MFDVCWICHLAIDLSFDRTFTVLQGDHATYAHLDCAALNGFKTPVAP